MDVLLTNSSDPVVVAKPTGTAPITNPLGEPPTAAALSPLAAAEAASKGSGIAEPLKNILGVDIEDSSVKNLIFISLIVWAFYKWGRKL